MLFASFVEELMAGLFIFLETEFDDLEGWKGGFLPQLLQLLSFSAEDIRKEGIIVLLDLLQLLLSLNLKYLSTYSTFESINKWETLGILM